MTANTGAVGAKLYFANKSIQHAGTVIIGGNLGHAYFKQFNPVGFHGDLETVHEVSAVTGACLAMRKEIWQKINGWDEQFENSYNDVELCFRLRDLGLRILQNNFVELYHFESFTRDATYSPAAKSLLESKWHEYLQDDPYFPQFAQTQPKLLRSAKRFVRRQLHNLGLYK
jgi:GT2 family glycosyltransferase